MTQDEPTDETPEDEPQPLPIDGTLDLHAFSPRDVPALVGDYLDECRARGILQVRIVHGKGIGVQRERVQSLLSRHPLVASYRDAPPERGSWGATVAYLIDSPEARLDD
jgi:DNA-nicking Smr family endonuclease